MKRRLRNFAEEQYWSECHRFNGSKIEKDFVADKRKPCAVPQAEAAEIADWRSVCRRNLRSRWPARLHEGTNERQGPG